MWNVECGRELAENRDSSFFSFFLSFFVFPLFPSQLSRFPEDSISARAPNFFIHSYPSHRIDPANRPSGIPRRAPPAVASMRGAWFDPRAGEAQATAVYKDEIWNCFLSRSGSS